MNAPTELARNLVIIVLAAASFGCTELRARHLAREGNRQFREGNYAAAVQAYAAALRLHPLPVVAFNQGLACRQLMLPGAKTPENERAVECALSAFSQLKRLDPADSRADQLYQQTLFDADSFERLAEIYTKQLRAKPDDPVALAHAVDLLRARGTEVIDCQVASAHTQSLGAVDIPRTRFLTLIRELCADCAPPRTWRLA